MTKLAVKQLLLCASKQTEWRECKFNDRDEWRGRQNHQKNPHAKVSQNTFLTHFCEDFLAVLSIPHLDPCRQGSCSDPEEGRGENWWKYIMFRKCNVFLSIHVPPLQDPCRASSCREPGVLEWTKGQKLCFHDFFPFVHSTPLLTHCRKLLQWSSLLTHCRNLPAGVLIFVVFCRHGAHLPDCSSCGLDHHLQHHLLHLSETTIHSSSPLTCTCTTACTAAFPHHPHQSKRIKVPNCSQNPCLLV